MIHELDRRFWIGGSDIDRYVLGNHATATWRKWWDMKRGRGGGGFSGNSATMTGNKLEHSILRAFCPTVGRAFGKKIPLPTVEWDGQIFYSPLRLRVNYDGWCNGYIYEVKCHRANNTLDLDKYRGQVTTQAWVYQKRQEELELPEFKGISILEYPFYPDEECARYDFETIENGLVPIDPKRIVEHKIKYKSKHFKAIEKALKPLAAELEEVNGIAEYASTDETAEQEIER